MAYNMTITNSVEVWMEGTALQMATHGANDEATRAELVALLAGSAGDSCVY